MQSFEYYLGVLAHFIVGGRILKNLVVGLSHNTLRFSSNKYFISAYCTFNADTSNLSTMFYLLKLHWENQTCMIASVTSINQFWLTVAFRSFNYLFVSHASF